MAVNPALKSDKADVEIVEDTSFHCASAYAEGEDKVAVLNFANAYSPDLVAEAFRKLLVDKGYGRFFRKIVFAIKKNDSRNSNLEAFRAVFEAE